MQRAAERIPASAGPIGPPEVIRTYLESLPAPLLDDSDEILLGSGEFRYRLENNWAKLPEGLSLLDVAAVDVDEQDRVYVFGRSKHPLMVFDREGNLLRLWNSDGFGRPHGIHVGSDGMIYCVDDGNHTLRKCTPEGKFLFTVGIPGVPSPYMSGLPFSRPTDVALAPNGDIYVTDGYQNAQVHKFSPNGAHLLTWGTSGVGPGEFILPHNIVCDRDGWVYVADRENHRIQVFDGNGRYETQWHVAHRPCGLHLARDNTFYIAELGPSMFHIRYAPNIGPRIGILSKDGSRIATVGDALPAHAADRFVAPHGVATDSRGDIYVGEVSYQYWNSVFPGVPVPQGLRSLRKLVKL